VAKDAPEADCTAGEAEFSKLAQGVSSTIQDAPPSAPESKCGATPGATLAAWTAGVRRPFPRLIAQD